MYRPACFLSFHRRGLDSYETLYFRLSFRIFSLHTLCKWNGENFKFDELWLVHWWTNFGSMFDLRSWMLAPFYQPSNLARLRWYWLSWQQKVQSRAEDCRVFSRTANSLRESLCGIFRCKSPERTTSDGLIGRIRSQQPLNQALCILNSRMFQYHWTLISDIESHTRLWELWPAPLFDVVICGFFRNTLPRGANMDNLFWRKFRVSRQRGPKKKG